MRTDSAYRVKGYSSALRLNLSFLESDLNKASMPPGEQQVLSKAQTPFSVWLLLVFVMHSCMCGMAARLAALLSPSLKTLCRLKVYSSKCSAFPKMHFLMGNWCALHGCEEGGAFWQIWLSRLRRQTKQTCSGIAQFSGNHSINH